MQVNDFETGPQPEDKLMTTFPGVDEEAWFKKHPGEFDPSTVKLGNTKATDKIKEKIEAAEAKHAAELAKWEEEFEKAEETEWQQYVANAALSPVTGELLTVGYLSTDNDKFSIQGDKPERDLLSDFWRQLTIARRSKRPVVGHNFKSFDLRFAVGRSWLLGVDVPSFVIQRGRYISDDVIVDTMGLWEVVTGKPFISLGNLAELLGVGSKTGNEEVTGATYHEFWHAGGERKQLAIDYLVHDLQLTAAVAERMGVL